MSDPKLTAAVSKQVEIEDLELSKETLQDLTEEESTGVQGGNLAQSAGQCNQFNLNTSQAHTCPHATQMPDDAICKDGHAVIY